MARKKKLRYGDKVLILGFPYKVWDTHLTSYGTHDDDMFFTQLGLTTLKDKRAFTERIVGYTSESRFDTVWWKDTDYEAAQRLIDALNAAPIVNPIAPLGRDIGDRYEVTIYPQHVMVGCNKIPFKDVSDIYHKMLEFQAMVKPKRKPRKRAKPKKAPKKKARGRVKRKR